MRRSPQNSATHGSPPLRPGKSIKTSCRGNYLQVPPAAFPTLEPEAELEAMEQVPEQQSALTAHAPAAGMQLALLHVPSTHAPAPQH